MLKQLHGRHRNHRRVQSLVLSSPCSDWSISNSALSFAALCCISIVIKSEVALPNEALIDCVVAITFRPEEYIPVSVITRDRKMQSLQNQQIAGGIVLKIPDQLSSFSKLMSASF